MVDIQPLATAVAVACFLVAAALVALGIWGFKGLRRR